MTENSGNNGNKTNKVLVVLCILLGLGCLFFALNTFVPGFQPIKSVEYKKLEDQKENLNTEYETVKSALAENKAQVESLKGKNADLDKLIEQRQEEIDKKQAEIETLMKKANRSASETSKLKELIKKLQDDNNNYLQQIQQLAEEKKVLIEQNTKLTTDLTEQKETNKKLEGDKKFLSSKYELGKLLKTNNISATGIKSKSNGKEIETDKINRLDKIRVCFETGDNNVRDAGDVTLYMRLVGPRGVTIAVESMGSGVAKLSDGTDVQYTKSVNFNYENKSKKVCIYWSQNVYEEGTYKAEVYQDGYKIGETSFSLR
jgi:hypothetical protein